MFSLNKIINYLFYLFVFVLPLQTRWIIKSGYINGGYWEYGTISLYASDIVLLILLMIFSFDYFRSLEIRLENKIFKDKIWWFIAGFDLIIFISIFVASDKVLAFYIYLRMIAGIGIFLLLQKIKINKIKLIFYFLFGLFVQAILGIWQFLNQHLFSTKWLGIAEHYAGSLGGVSVVETLNNERWLRAYGGLDHPNILGGLMCIGILLAIYLFVLKNLNQSYKIILLVFLEVFTSALFFTFSRSAWLGLILGIISLLLFIIYSKDKTRLLKILKMVLASGIMFFILMIFYNNLLDSRFANEMRLEKLSNVERINSISQSILIIKEDKFMGKGIGNYTLGIKKYINNKMEINKYQPVHNVYLLILAEIGIFGILYYGLIINEITRKKYKTALFSLLISMLIMQIFDHWWWSLHVGVLLSWFLLGLVYKAK